MAEDPSPLDAATLPMGSALYHRKQLVKAVQLEAPAVLSNSLGEPVAQGVAGNWLVEDAYGRRSIHPSDIFETQFELAVSVIKS